jgi:hypothetical protein
MVNVPFNRDTNALIQRGVIQKPGFYGSQELKPSNDTFNQAVQIGAQLVGFALGLKNNPLPPSNYARTQNNYILTQNEKNAVTNISTQLASYGVIPYDALETFFYILAANQSYNDLVTISNCIGIPELGDQQYIQNIIGITQIQSIYKVGYLAQGVASINNTYGSRFGQAQQYADPNQGSYGGVLSAANLGTNLGVIGPAILGNAYNNTGWGGPLSQSPQLSLSSITGAVTNYQSLANGGGSLPPTTISALLNPAATVQQSASLVGGNLIGGLLNQSPLGGALGQFGQLGGIVAGLLLGKSGGNALGGFMSEIVLGQRLSTSKLANNPMLTPPSYAGKSFFGEAPVALPAVDQVFCRKVGAFGSTQGGNGVVSFGMQNFASFGGSQPIASVISRLLTGSSVVPPTNTYYGQQVNTLINNSCNQMNVPTSSNIEMRRADNSIPFMLSLSAVSIGENFSPFGSSAFTGGWKLAASTANDIQKYNPQYLQACRTSL